MYLQGKKTPLPNGEAVMCAYKLCKVEFRYWGMQTKIEKFIHDVGMYSKTLHTYSIALLFWYVVLLFCELLFEWFYFDGYTQNMLLDRICVHTIMKIF